MKFIQKLKTLSVFLILFTSFTDVQSQNFGLKILQVSDSSSIDQHLVKFDSLWYTCMQKYGKKDVSTLFADNTKGTSKTHPITLLNFISGIDAPLSDVFPFKLIHKGSMNDSVMLYQLDMGWMQLATLYHVKQQKLLRFESFNMFNLIPNVYQNLTVYSTSTIPKKELLNSYRQVTDAMKILGIDPITFTSKNIIIYSGATLKDAYSFVGGLEYVNFFNPGAQFGGMGDPYNRVILSGIPKPIHVHELLHFAINFQCNYFVGEGLASYFGGIGEKSYNSNLTQVLKILKEQNVHTFSESLNLWMRVPYFNAIRGNYVMSAHMLACVQRDFNQKTFQEFVRNCTTNEQMIASLKTLYKFDTEEAVFNHFFHK